MNDKVARDAARPVYFVGAGPGAPDLITVRGKRLVDTADLIIYAGSLVNPAVFSHSKAKILDSSGMDLEQIIDAMANGYRQGQLVVRLHTGDPSLFGATMEQMRRLDMLNIPYEVVPGVSSASASAASLKKELTCPGISQTVIFTRRAGRTPVPPGQDIPSLASHQATMCIFLSVSVIDELAGELVQGGYPESTPAAVIERASWPEERVITGTLGDIGPKVRKAGIKRTAMILVGGALSPGKEARDSRLYDPAFSHGYRNGIE